MRRTVTSILIVSLVLLGTRALQYAHQWQHQIVATACAAQGGEHSHGPSSPERSDRQCQLCVQFHCTHLLPCTMPPLALVSAYSGTQHIVDELAPAVLACRRNMCRGPPEAGLRG